MYTYVNMFVCESNKREWGALMPTDDKMSHIKKLALFRERNTPVEHCVVYYYIVQLNFQAQTMLQYDAYAVPINYVAHLEKSNGKGEVGQKHLNF